MQARTFARQVVDGFARHDGAKLARLVDTRISDGEAVTVSGTGLTESQEKFVNCLIRSNRVPDLAESQDALRESLTYLVTDLANEDQWIVPLLKALWKRTRRLTLECARQSGKADVFTATIRALQTMMPPLLRDRAAWSESKKPAILALAVEMYRVYFAINNLNLCRQLASLQIPSPLDEDAEEQYPRADAVAFAFYSGRYALLEHKLADADRYLSFAYKHCHRDSRNVKVIVKYLIPLWLRRGRLPRPELLARFELSEFEPVVKAVRTGEVRLLDQALEQHQEKYVRWGVYLMLERLRPVVYRTLLRRVHRLLGSGSRIPLEVLDRASLAAGAGDDKDENECLLANLIYDGYVRGYIAHSRRILVVAKSAADVFPPLAKVSK